MVCLKNHVIGLKIKEKRVIKGKKVFRDQGVCMLTKKMIMIGALALMSLNGTMVVASHNSNTDDDPFSDVEATVDYQQKSRSFGDLIRNNKAITGVIGAAACL